MASKPKFRFPLLLALVTGLTGLAGSAGAADPVPYRTDAYPLTLSASAGLSHTILVSDARWLRVHFQSYDIVDSEITIAASGGGESQTLHGIDISTWNEASAFFDGNSLLLTLVLAPGEAGASVTIDELSVGVPRIEPAPSLCGSDDRVALVGSGGQWGCSRDTHPSGRYPHNRRISRLYEGHDRVQPIARCGHRKGDDFSRRRPRPGARASGPAVADTLGKGGVCQWRSHSRG